MESDGKGKERPLGLSPQQQCAREIQGTCLACHLQELRVDKPSCYPKGYCSSLELERLINKSRVPVQDKSKVGENEKLRLVNSHSH